MPIFRYCCRVFWIWTLLGALAAAATLSGLTLLLNRGGRGGALPARAGFLALILLAGAAAAAWVGSFAFPETAGSSLAALLLFGLSAAAARLGPAAAGRCAGILLWTTGGLYGIVLLFSLPQIHLPWLLLPAGSPLPDAALVWAAMTAPGAGLCLAGALGEDQKLPHWPWWVGALIAVVASAATGGILSPALAGEQEAFRTLARGVSVLGVMRRFEALVNGAMLMSAFCLCTLLLTAAAALTRDAK